MAQEFEAVGWKINGASREGGSVTILCSATMSKKREMIKRIQSETQFEVIETRLQHNGVKAWTLDK